MVEETKPEPKPEPTEEPQEEKATPLNMIEQANKAAERLEKANKENERLLKEKEAQMIEAKLSGEAELTEHKSEEEKEKEETRKLLADGIECPGVTD